MNWVQINIIVGTTALIAGIANNYIISKRKFKRKTIAGSEVFSNYPKSKLVPLTERFGRLIALLLILGGIFVVIITIAR